MNRMSQISATALLLLACVIAGCGRGSRPKTIQFEGNVTYGGGEWPAGGTIYMLPVEPAEGYSRRSATVAFDVDGAFGSPTSWEEGDGVVPGRYRVFVECWKVEPTIDGPPSVSYVDARYVSAATSDIEVEITVESEGQEFQWDFAPNRG